MAHCLVQLNSYSNSALSLAHHSPISSPPPASIAARTRHESRSQACGSREVDARTQQSANTCKVSGWAVASFKLICASRCLCLDVPASYTEHKDCPSIVKHTLGTHLGYTAQSNDDASECDQSEGSDPPSNVKLTPSEATESPSSLVSAPFSRVGLD